MLNETPAPPAPSYWSRARGPWRIAGFRWYWLAAFAQSVGQGMQFFVLVWLTLDLTGSSIGLTGLMVFLYGIPNTALLPFGGVIADRLNRKLLLMATQAGVGAVIGGVAALSLSGAVAMWHVYLAVALLGVLQALNQPARVTVLSDLVGERTLLDAVAQFNAAVHVGRIVGPPLAGILIDGPPYIEGYAAVWGIGAGLAANAVFYGISVLFLSPIHWTPSAVAEPILQYMPAGRPVIKFLRLVAATSIGLLRYVSNGLSVIRNSPVLLTVIVLTCAFGGFGMSHLQVIPAFAKDRLGADATQAGLMLLASGIGSLAGSLAITFMHRAWLYRWLLACLIVFAGMLTLFGWSSTFWMAWTLFMLLGSVSLGTVWPLATTILQLAAPPEARGRVMGILHFTPGFHYLGAWPLSVVAAAAGWPMAITGAAGLCLSVTLGFGLLRRAGRDLARRPAGG